MIEYLTTKFKNFVVTLRFSILSIFIVLFIITVTLVYSISEYRFKEILLYTSYTIMEQQSNSILNALTNIMHPIELEAQFTAELLSNNVINNNDLNQIMQYTYYLKKLLPISKAIRWANEQGSFVISQLEEDGTILSEILDQQKHVHIIIKRDLDGKVISRSQSTDFTYDPRKRPWYIQIKTLNKSSWIDVFRYMRYSTFAITSAAPIFKNGVFQSVFGIDIELNFLNKFIEEHRVSVNGFSYIVTINGKLIAFPTINNDIKNLKEKNSQLILSDLSSVSMPWIIESLEKYKQTGDTKFVLKTSNQNFLFMYKPIDALNKFGWLVGVMIPESDLTNQLESMHYVTYRLCMITLLLGLILLSNLVTRIVKPIKQVVVETEKIKNFELDSDIKIQSKIKEVVDLSNAIRAMQKGLRSFQKYVPKVLVKQLIETQEDIRMGGIRKPLAILFSDIKNFTTIAETVDPNLLTNQLCEYFDELTRIIIECRGTIDKYIGDSIMAFWGAPLPETDASFQAALAAIRCEKKLKECNMKWLSQGKLPFITRIGIHMGDAIIGNVGSSERLNYTAVGDTINMASRFESINKLYGTSILVSDVVYQVIKNDFVLRMVDCVTVRGRKDSNYIYELIAEHKSEVPYDIDQYRDFFAHGFTKYTEREFKSAISFFQQCVSIFPDDTVAPIFIRRCQVFMQAPPPDDWVGVFKIEV